MGESPKNRLAYSNKIYEIMGCGACDFLEFSLEIGAIVEATVL